MAAARTSPNDAYEAIYRMEPSAAGEDDAYSAATKVGPLARSHVAALMAKATAEENSSIPPPISTTRCLSIPKAARMPVMATTLASEGQEVQRMYDEVEDGDLFDPTALFEAPAAGQAVRGNTLRIENQNVRAVLEAAMPLRCDADWTRAPTLMAISVPPRPATLSLAPLLEPAPIARRPRRSTFGMEVAIFVGTFLLVAIPAAMAYWIWMR
jgi:hypothetical protein